MLWVDELNNGMTPDVMAPKSEKTITMRCIRNSEHIYPIRISAISKNEPYGCPYCRKQSKIIPGKSDLFSISQIAKRMWSYEDNSGYDLLSISPSSAESVVWICEKGHHFKRSIYKFVRNQKCSKCKISKNAISRFPHMINLWDFEKNKEMDVDITSSCSKKSAYWLCKKCGYNWEAKISSRKVSKGQCPCCETRIVVSKGKTDLFSMVPNLREWYDVEKNIDIDITELSVSSGDEVWWKCPNCSYSWCGPPSGRVVPNNNGYDIRNCAACAGLRRTLTYAEEFPELSDRFIVKLNGCTLADIKGEMRKDSFWWYCDNCTTEFESSVDSMIQSRNSASKGCPYCSGKKVKRENSFAYRHPEVMDEYDPANDIDPYTVTEYSTKNVKWICRTDNTHKWSIPFVSRVHGEGTCKVCRGYQYGKMFFEEHSECEKYYDKAKNEKPFESFTYMSNEEVWWKCDKGHSFTRRIFHMSKIGYFKCAICENMIIQIGENDLASQYPELAKEFDIKKNKMTPQNIMINSSDSEINWICAEGHEFKRSVSSRINQFGECPVCNRTLLVKGINDFQHTYPQIVGLWDYEMNDRAPDEITDHCNYKFNYKCDKGHHYAKNLSTIKANDFKCLVCSNKIIILGENSLVDSDFELSQEFSPIEERKASEFTKESAYSPLWRCTVCNNDYHWPIRDRESGNVNCPFCNNRYTRIGVNSIADTDQELSKEYASDNEYDVTRVNKNSKTWGYWICPSCNGRYGAYVNERKLGDDSCPYCTDKRALEGLNSLVDTHYQLVKDWSINNERNPEELLKSSKYTALWKCPTCCGEYPARICDREVGDDNCPYCNNRITLSGVNTFNVKHEDLMEEWDYINNYLLCNADQILDTYSKEVWWNCQVCKTKYLMSPKRRVYYQTRSMKSCSYCKGLRRKKYYYF